MDLLPVYNANTTKALGYVFVFNTNHLALFTCSERHQQVVQAAGLLMLVEQTFRLLLAAIDTGFDRSVNVLFRLDVGIRTGMPALWCPQSEC